MKTAYKREYINAGLDVDLDFAGPTIHGAAVAGYEGWLAGYQMTFDSAKSKMLQSNFAIGYKTGDFQLHTNMYILLLTIITIIIINNFLSNAHWILTLSPLEIMDLSLVAPSTRMLTTNWKRPWTWPGLPEATAPALELLPNTS